MYPRKIKILLTFLHLQLCKTGKQTCFHDDDDEKTGSQLLVKELYKSDPMTPEDFTPPPLIFSLRFWIWLARQLLGSLEVL